MSRGELDETTHQLIASQVPNVITLQRKVLQLDPNIISFKCNVNSSIPAAVSCFHDAVNILAQASYAMYEAIAHKSWYLEKVNPPKELEANYFAVYYADDTALRLYSAAEHLAEGIIHMLEIRREDLAKYKEKRTSLQITLGKYLGKEMPTHPIAKELMVIAKADVWQKMRAYRDNWVHNQPPLVKGVGLSYRRGQRWKKDPSGKGHIMEIRFGDEAEYTPEDLLGFMMPALCIFTNFLNKAVDYYSNLIEKKSLDNLHPIFQKPTN